MLEKIIETNKLICSEQEQSFGIVNKHLLESIGDSVDQAVFGKVLYPSVEDKISFIVSSIIKNHCFVDGNKRTGILIFFMLVNEYNVKHKLTSDDKTFEVVLKIAENKFDVEETKSLLFK